MGLEKEKKVARNPMKWFLNILNYAIIYKNENRI